MTLKSLNQAVAHGQALGASAREKRLPPDIFEKVLQEMLDRWKGVDALWELAAESAARAAYFAVKP